MHIRRSPAARFFPLLLILASGIGCTEPTPAVNALPSPNAEARPQVEAPAPKPSDESPARAVALPDSAEHKVVSAEGRSYTLMVRLPPGYSEPENAERRYPVIYFNDAGYTFITAAGATSSPMRHGALADAILVGVSYAEGEGGRQSRSRDLTPTSSASFPDVETGGAAKYLGFFKDVVIPHIDQRYRSDVGHRMLVGQSYGGLFGFYALLNAPGLFHDYVLTSPSLWFDNEVMFRMEREVAASGTPLSGRVFVTTGALEHPGASGGRNDMVEQQHRFVRQLEARGHSGLIIRSETVPDAAHLTTFPVGLTRGLSWLLPGENPFAG